MEYYLWCLGFENSRISQSLIDSIQDKTDSLLPNNLTKKEVINVKKFFPKNMTLSIKDKNSGHIRVECDILAGRRIQKEIYNCENFKIVPYKTNQIMDKLKHLYKQYNLSKIGRWRRGKLPRDYTLPKQKDPINKARLIASYFLHPLQSVFQNASKVLTWLFKTIVKYGMFHTLQSG